MKNTYIETVLNTDLVGHRFKMKYRSNFYGVARNNTKTKTF